MAGSIEESYLLAVASDLVCGRMLCDAACLARDDIGVADSVQKRGLSVVDVPEYADNRRARNVIFNVVLRPFYGLFSWAAAVRPYALYRD